MQWSVTYPVWYQILFCKIWGFHGGDYDDYHLLGDDNHQILFWLQNFIHHCILIKIQFWSHFFITMDRKQKTGFVDKSINAIIANHYDPDIWGSSPATTKSKRCFLKSHEVWDWPLSVRIEIKVNFPWFNIKSLRLMIFILYFISL
jgi:hypothetical protein